MDSNSFSRPFEGPSLEIIKQSFFDVQAGIFVYAKVRTLPPAGKHFMVSQDGDEITVVTRGDLSSLDLIERNKDDYVLIALNVAVPFYSVGFLATVSDAFAANDMNILIISTYSKDYILVRADRLDLSQEILLKLGFQKRSEPALS